MSAPDAFQAIPALLAAVAELPRTLGELSDRIGRLEAEVLAVRRTLPPPLATLSRAAAVLGVSLSTIRRRVRDGSLPVRRVGRSLRIDLGALHAPSEAAVAQLARVTRMRG